MAESNSPNPVPASSWERDALERLARAALDEQRRARRWGIFFKSLTFLYLFVLLFVFLGLFGGQGRRATPDGIPPWSNSTA